MFKNYFKIAFRSLLKNKAYGFLNILGLSVGITCAALIFLWVENEITYDSHHANKEFLFAVMENQTYDGTTYTFGATPGPLASAVKAEIPGVKNAARTDWGSEKLFSLEDKQINERGNYADASFLKMFRFPFVKGSADKAFSEVHSIIITEQMARKFFGDKDAYGKSIKMNNEQEYVITGVLKDLPLNSSFNFQWLLPYKLYEDQNTWLKGWGSNGIQTFLELEPGADIESINKKLHNFITTREPKAIARPFLFAMSDWRLHSRFEEGKSAGGRIEYVRLFTVIAWIIIFIACINFMNLATARSERRAKEVGVRKVMGAGRGKLMGQFLAESLIMSFVSVLIAVVLILLLLPSFNNLVENQLSLRFNDLTHIFGLLGVAVICGLIAGSYPAFYLSSFNPITVFKGLIKGSTSATYIRKGLVVAQFVISIVLIISTVIIYQQIQHVKNRQLGYNKDKLIYLNLQGKMKEHFTTIKENLLSTGVVENAAVSYSNVLQMGNNGDGFTWPGKDPAKKILVTNEWVSPDYVSTLGMEIKAGRDFRSNAALDSVNILVNESFARLMGKETPVGEIVKFRGTDHRIVGVVKDFVFNDMYEKAAPLVMFCQPAATNYMFIRFKKGVDLTQALAKAGSILKEHNPGYPFDYDFLDEEFNSLFKSEMLIGKLSRLFAVLAIFISCLGLFGLAAYTAEKRTKEIGIRRVLGATVGNIAGLISKDFVSLVLLAVLIAFPLSWLAMTRWLQDYAYHITINWMVFMVAGVAAFIIALLTVGFQAVKAALSNPVKSLRSE